MSPTIPHFGDAVHAVLAYLKHGDDPLTLEFETFRSKVLPHYVEYRYLTYSPQVWRRVFAFWQFVGELVKLADDVWIEPRTPNGKNPDLVITHGGRVYVIDIKSIHPDADLSWGKPGMKVYDQVLGSAREIDRMLGGRMPCYGYVLRIDSTPDSAREPMLLPIGDEAR